MKSQTPENEPLPGICENMFQFPRAVVICCLTSANPTSLSQNPSARNSLNAQCQDLTSSQQKQRTSAPLSISFQHAQVQHHLLNKQQRRQRRSSARSPLVKTLKKLQKQQFNNLCTRVNRFSRTAALVSST